jgi:hypothetical protein
MFASLHFAAVRCVLSRRRPGVEPLYYKTLRFGTSERQAASARSSACSYAVIAASVNFDFFACWA